jgi:hypothetical protein
MPGRASPAPAPGPGRKAGELSILAAEWHRTYK